MTIAFWKRDGFGLSDAQATRVRRLHAGEDIPDAEELFAIKATPDRIRALRSGSGMMQIELAALAGVAKATVCRIVNRDRRDKAEKRLADGIKPKRLNSKAGPVGAWTPAVPPARFELDSSVRFGESPRAERDHGSAGGLPAPMTWALGGTSLA